MSLAGVARDTVSNPAAWWVSSMSRQAQWEMVEVTEDVEAAPKNAALMDIGVLAFKSLLPITSSCLLFAATF